MSSAQERKIKPTAQKEVLASFTEVKQTLTQKTTTVTPILAATTIQTTQWTEKPRIVHCKTSDKTNLSTDECYFGAKSANKPPTPIKEPIAQSQS